MISRILTMGVMAATLFVSAGRAGAQANADAAARLRQVLPADVATRVFAVIERARGRGLPADALENRALKFAAKGIEAKAIEKSVVEQEDRMERVRDLLQTARARKPMDDEIEAGAEAMRKGIDGAKVTSLAKDAPNDRSLAVPLYVIGSLLDRGLPLDTAVRRVKDRLKTRASDRDIEKMAVDGPPDAANNGRGRGAETGRALGTAKHPGGGPGNSNGSAGGPPAGVPGNGGKPAIPPGQAKKPPKKP